MSDVKNMIDEMKDPMLLVVEKLNQELDSQCATIVELEKRIDIVIDKVYQLSQELTKQIEEPTAMTANWVTLEKRVNELEQWSNVHTHAQSEELKYKKTKDQVRAGRHVPRTKAAQLAMMKRIKEQYPEPGKFCLQCHRPLTPGKRNQYIFCSPGHASKWYQEHGSETPYPLYKLHSGGFETRVTAGEGVESPAYAAPA